ncbi:hypothetical protein F5888DRAFT_127538 [Russula emetica]|nr:hypothetical protein F5888DRAFT_127538 [Russula emetica]
MCHLTIAATAPSSTAAKDVTSSLLFRRSALALFLIYLFFPIHLHCIRLSPLLPRCHHLSFSVHTFAWAININQPPYVPLLDSSVRHSVTVALTYPTR